MSFIHVRSSSGNVTSGEGVAYLSECGANVIKIGQGPGSGRYLRHQLGGVPEMAVPKVGQGTFRYQVVPSVPVGQEIGIGFELGQCFT